jgi:membrane protein required for beta-lactamase induction
MIQIIGFLLCAMLAVKLLEMAGNSSLRDENGSTRPTVDAAIWVGWASVFGFAFWLLVQGDAFPKTQLAEPPTSALTQEQIDCINNAKPGEDILAC